MFKSPTVSNCPDHARALGDAPRSCPLCRGTFFTEQQLEQQVPRAFTVLETEARPDALPFKKPRNCPDCGQHMVPLRIGRLEAWIERCPSCEGLWVEASDLASLKLVTKSVARQEAWQSIDEGTRKGMARELAEEMAPKSELPVEQLSVGGAAQAMVGVPLLDSLEGAQGPIATAITFTALALVFLAALVVPDPFDFDALAYRPEVHGVWRAFVAVFAHDGWAHILGNLLFGAVFGDAVERKTPRWVVPVAVFGVGGLTLLIDGALSSTDAVIGGASGGVFALMGLSAVLQRRARWLVPMLGWSALRLPLPVVMGVYAAIDLAIGSQQGSGIAWIAHAAGLVAGIALGVGLSRSESRPSP